LVSPYDIWQRKQRLDSLSRRYAQFPSMFGAQLDKLDEGGC
jgi:hypothetical protein